MPRPTDHKWTDEENVRFIQMHRDGVSFRALGREFGIGKNSAVLHAAALFLPRRNPDRTPKPVARNPDAPCIVRPPRVAPPPALPIPPPKSCCYPLWPHGARPTQEFCGAALVPGRSWCAEHTPVVTAKPADIAHAERYVNEVQPGRYQTGMMPVSAT